MSSAQGIACDQRCQAFRMLDQGIISGLLRKLPNHAAVILSPIVQQESPAPKHNGFPITAFGNDNPGGLLSYPEIRRHYLWLSSLLRRVPKSPRRHSRDPLGGNPLPF